MPHWEFSRWASPCACSKGRFIIGWKSENYPPCRNQYEASTDCPQCERDYYDLDAIHLSRRSDHEAYHAAYKARSAAWNADPDVVGITQALLKALSGLENGVVVVGGSRSAVSP
jgi:hypothetical protein